MDFNFDGRFLDCSPEIVRGAAPRPRRGFGGQAPPFRIFAGGSRRRRRRKRFGLFQEYCTSLMQNQIRVIYKDKNFLALYKPAGLLVHPAKSRIKEATLVDWLLKRFPEIKNVGDEPQTRPGIVHRLDKYTSGVLLVARNQKYFEYLKKLFKTGKIKKTYLALVWGKLEPKTGVIKKSISLKSGTVKRTVWKGRLEKEAITEYRVVKFIKLKVNKEKEQIFSLVEVMPKTGRTHQIRVHLSSIGHSIVGDSLYGPKENLFGLKRQFLHAKSLEFSAEEGKRIKIEAELPQELREFIQNLESKTNKF